MLERAMQVSPYGGLFWSNNPKSGPIVRNQATELMIVDLSGENTSQGLWHRGIGKRMMDRQFPVVSYQTPVGDVDKRGSI
ncbi:MAG TPA: hypothetical protein VFB59_00685 [Candidatus Saccharimonadales bacterium]|nr:hypothetical protein [Candidatus Saccharimonadales bacterium]